MNCREIEELLYDYASKRLGGKDKEVVEAHLKTCDLCRDALLTIEKTLPVLDYWSTQTLPADYSERVLKEIFEKKTTFWQRFINTLSPPIHIQIPVKGLAVVALVCSALISYKLFYLTPVYEVLPRVTPPMEQKKEAERYAPPTFKSLEEEKGGKVLEPNREWGLALPKAPSNKRSLYDMVPPNVAPNLAQQKTKVTAVPSGVPKKIEKEKGSDMRIASVPGEKFKGAPPEKSQTEQLPYETLGNVLHGTSFQKQIEAKREPSGASVGSVVGMAHPSFQESPKPSADPVKANTAFALDLYNKLKTAEGNLFFSPYSISTALAMTYAGARGNTEREIAEVLHFALNQGGPHSSFAKLQGHLNEVRKKGNIRLNIANALWAQKDYRFLRTFTDLVTKSYEAEAKNVDFREKTENVRKKINAWIEEKTENKIVELLKPGTVSGDTRLILTNAIYFKGNWASQFKKSETTEMPFKLNSAKSVMVPMMQKNKETFKYAENAKLQILELPYKGNELSMVVLLPREVDGIRSLEREFSTETLNMWLNSLHKQEVEIYLPKFKSEYEMSLTAHLKDMGMKSAFTPDVADFSGMDGTKSLYISDVLHKAFVNVDEEGTEAAAATAVVMYPNAFVERHIPVFRADHPFIFLIRDNTTGSILFMGRISNPKAENS
jgi:serpin B